MARPLVLLKVPNEVRSSYQLSPPWLPWWVVGQNGQEEEYSGFQGLTLCFRPTRSARGCDLR
jgi:hypothetical protein